MRKDIGSIKRTLFILLEIIASIKKSEYIACSASEQDIIKRFIPTRKCHLVENAVDIKDLPSPRIPSEAHQITEVITVGQIRPQKSPELFLQIYKIVKSQTPGITFKWIGDGDESSKNRLKESGIIVTGWLTKTAVFNSLNTSGIYLSTAQWEGMPVSLIEALIAGLPVVASNCSGNTDVIQHKVNGYLYKSASAAADQILEIINNPSGALSHAKHCQTDAKERFSITRYVKEIEEITRKGLICNLQ